jgi:hypothetical protein
MYWDCKEELLSSGFTFVPTNMRNSAISRKILSITFLVSAIAFASCGSKKKKDKVQDVTIQNIHGDIDTETLLPPPRPEAEIKDAIQKCFKNDGLKYSVTINMFINDKEVTGQVSSQETGSAKITNTDFKGMINDDKLTIKFNGAAPVVGDASEWTNNVWTITKKGDAETLQIIFNAKNYDTNKWGDVKYEFVACK